MPHETIAKTVVAQFATDCEKASELLNELTDLNDRDVITAYGVNTRTEELEIVHGKTDLGVFDASDSGTEDPVEEIREAFEGIGVSVRLMTWGPEAIIDALSEYVGRDVQNGWYEGDEWCCAVRDYCHAVYYLRGRHSHILDKYQKQC